MSPALAVIPPTEQQRWHEFYKTAPLIIILLYMRTRARPVTQTEIASNFQINRRTAASALRTLSSQGHVIRTGSTNKSAYQLTDGGQQMLLEMGTNSISVQSAQISLSLSTKNLNIKYLKKERKSNLCKNCTTEQILAQTGKLFHREVISHGITDSDPDYVMAWLAQAYDQRAALKAPQVLVYRRLQASKDLPQNRYQADPLAFLPNDFLVALGLAEPEIIELETEDMPKTVTPKQDTAAAAQAQRAWDNVLDQIIQQMPRKQYNDWMADTRGTELEGDVLTVSASSQQVAEILTDRMTATAQRLLIGILDQPDIRVEFVPRTKQD